jgi:glycosidase
MKKYFFLILLAAGWCNFSFANLQVERVEPPHWWTGMYHAEWQVMLYGQNIGQLNPAISYKGVRVSRTVRAENNNYLFVYLTATPDAKPGTFDIKLQKNGKTKVSVPYMLKERRPQSAFREGFNNSDAIYLVYPDRFANGNPDNDNVKGYPDKWNRSDDYGRHGGDLQGIIDHLDYIQEMGFTAMWLNPVMENNMPEASYHGYAITDFYRVDPRLGTNALYKKLSQEAKKRGIKLIQDMIMNHCGSEHWWMQNPPYSDWVHYQDSFKITNHYRHTLQDPYAAQSDKKLFEEGWFVEAMPDMNQSNPMMADYLIYNSVFWIEEADLGGIRHDTHPYSGMEFLSRWTRHIMKEYPHFNIVGEEWSTNPAILAKWQRGSNLPVDFASELPSLMDFPLQDALVAALKHEDSWGNGFAKIYETLADDYLYPEPFNLVVFPDNHDMDRFYRQVNNDFDLYKMGIVYILTTRGIPQIQYGTELLFSNEKPHDHGQIREDFPGGWQGDETNGFTGKGLTEKEQEARSFMQTMLNYRKNSSVLHDGNLMQYAPQRDGTYTYFRYNNQKTIMVTFNKNQEARLIDTGRFHERIQTSGSATDVLTGKKYALDNLTIPARSVLVLEIDRVK